MGNNGLIPKREMRSWSFPHSTRTENKENQCDTYNSNTRTQEANESRSPDHISNRNGQNKQNTRHHRNCKPMFSLHPDELEHFG